MIKENIPIKWHFWLILILSPIWKLSWTSLSPHLYGEKILSFLKYVSLVLLFEAVKIRLWSYLYYQRLPKNSFPGGFVLRSLPICLLVINKIHFCLRDNDRGFSAGLPWWLRHKESASNAGDSSSIPGSGRSPGEGNGNPLQYSCLENPMDRGAQGVAELDTTGVSNIEDFAQRTWKALFRGSLEKS